MGGKNSQTTVLLEVKGDDPWLEYSLQSLLGFGGGGQGDTKHRKKAISESQEGDERDKAEWKQSSEVGVEAFPIGYHRGWL